MPPLFIDPTLPHNFDVGRQVSELLVLNLRSDALDMIFARELEKIIQRNESDMVLIEKEEMPVVRSPNGDRQSDIIVSCFWFYAQDVFDLSGELVSHKNRLVRLDNGLRDGSRGDTLGRYTFGSGGRFPFFFFHHSCFLFFS